MASHLQLLIITIFTISVTAALLTGGILGGVLTCTNASVAVAGTYPVIPDARVDLFCGTPLPVLIQSTRTNTAGIYNFLITSLDTALIDGGKCYLNVTIPPNSCTLNIPTGSVGILKIPVVVLRSIDALVGKLLILVAGPVSFILSHI